MSKHASGTSNAERRREAERQHRRQHILLSAERVFSRTPYDEASMLEIAAEAGIGMNGLYQHFASKEELWAAIVRLRITEIEERLPAPTEVADPLQRIRALAEVYAGFFLERPQFLPVFQSQRICVSWDLRSRFTDLSRSFGVRELDDELCKAIQAGVDTGLLAPRDPRRLTLVAINVFNAVIQDHLLAKRPDTAAQCADEILELFLQGAANDPRRGRRGAAPLSADPRPTPDRDPLPPAAAARGRAKPRPVPSRRARTISSPLPRGDK